MRFLQLILPLFLIIVTLNVKDLVRSLPPWGAKWLVFIDTKISSFHNHNFCKSQVILEGASSFTQTWHSKGQVQIHFDKSVDCPQKNKAKVVPTNHHAHPLPSCTPCHVWPPPCHTCPPPVDRPTPVKTLPSENSFAAGKNLGDQANNPGKQL